MKIKNLGMILLAVWLIANGLLLLLDIQFPYSSILLALLGLAAGIMILLKR